MSVWQSLIGETHELSESVEPLSEERKTPGVRIEVQRLNKFFGTHHVLRDLSLEIGRAHV